VWWPPRLPLTTAHAAGECDNATLLARVAAGDQLAWRRLIDEYDGVVRSVAASCRLEKADVHDVRSRPGCACSRKVHTVRVPGAAGGVARRHRIAEVVGNPAPGFPTPNAQLGAYRA
jgi:hypothetical protein